MWIVRLALRRPYTFVVMSALIAAINVPVVSAIWSYGGLSPEEMQERITTIVANCQTLIPPRSTRAVPRPPMSTPR